MSEMGDIHVWVPFYEFRAADRDYELADGLVLRRCSAIPDLNGQEEYLSKLDRMKLDGTSHWLEHSHSADAPLKAVEVAMLVLIALWLIRPTKTHIRQRFELSITKPGTNKLCTDASRFNYVDGAVSEGYSDDDLDAAARLYQILLQILLRRGRLSDAILLTLNGCLAFQWQANIICHVAALETLLTDSDGNGLATRLLTAYACMVETELALRMRAFRECELVYMRRSDITHGRMARVPADARLETVGRLQNVLRGLWNRVLADGEAIRALEGNDAVRRAFFENLQRGFVAPAR